MDWRKKLATLGLAALLGFAGCGESEREKKINRLYNDSGGHYTNFYIPGGWTDGRLHELTLDRKHIKAYVVDLDDFQYSIDGTHVFVDGKSVSVYHDEKEVKDERVRRSAEILADRILDKLISEQIARNEQKSRQLTRNID